MSQGKNKNPINVAKVNLSTGTGNTNQPSKSNTVKLPPQVKFVDFPIRNQILLQNLLVRRTEGLPLLPLRKEGYYADNISQNKKWYLPEITLKTPADGGFRFACFKDGIDANGKDVYKGVLTLGLRKNEPDAIRKLREKSGDTCTFEPIPITYLSGTIVLKLENRDVPVSVSAQLDPAKPDIELAVPIPKDSLGLWYRTMKDPTLGAPMTLEAQFIAWEKPAAAHQVDLLNLAAKARWHTGELTGANNFRIATAIPFQGSEGDNRGFARVDTAYLEDGKAYRVLRTHPNWAARGSIKGFFPDTPLPKNAQFEARVGFLKGATKSDGVTFQVWEHHYDHEKKCRVCNKIAAKHKPYDGKILTLRANLSHLEGQPVGLELRVDAGASSGQDWAAWVEPRISGDELVKKTITVRHTFELSSPCSRHPEFYVLQRADGSAVSFGCTPPWDANYSPDAPYVAYHKTNLSDLGVSSVFKSILRDDQFLLVPSKYVIARDADALPEIFVSVQADLNDAEKSKALLDVKLAPDISDFQLLQIKKRLVLSWDGADLSDTIDLVFPSQVGDVQNDNPEITPVVRLTADENYAHGPGIALHLSLENLSLHHTSLVMLNITEALGRSFRFDIKPGGNLAPVSSSAVLTLKDLAGCFVYAVRTDNVLQLVNLLDRSVQANQIVADTPGRKVNPTVPVGKQIEGGATLPFDLPETLCAGVGFAADYTVGTGTEYVIRENNVTTDNIRQDFTVDCGAIFQDPDVASVELTVQMKDSANNVVAVFDSARSTGIVALRLPVGFYLAARIIDFALRITYRNSATPERTCTGKFNLRENNLLLLAEHLASTT